MWLLINLPISLDWDFSDHLLMFKIEISLYLCIQPEGSDDVKKQQLMELAIINGTYRDPQQRNSGVTQSSSSPQQSSPSPLSPSLTFDEFDRELSWRMGQI